MKTDFHFIKKNIWLRISGYNSFSVLSRLISSWIINKLIAIYIGPAGTSYTEQFRNFIQGLQAISVLGTQEGVTKFTAQYQNKKDSLKDFMHFSIKMVFLISIFIGLLIAFFASQINHYLFPGSNFVSVIFWTGISLPILSLNMIFLSILRGLQEYKTIVYINVLTNIISAILALWLILQFKIKGALFLVLITQYILFFLNICGFFYNKIEWKNFWGKTTFNYLKKLYPFMLMALVSAFIIPFFNILIRNHIFHFFNQEGVVQAGYWDATKKISNLYLSLITPVFTMYYYPQMAKISYSDDFKYEIMKFAKQILPLFSLGIFLLYVFRRFIIKFFFSEDYLPMESLFSWQLAGDYLKVISLLIAYLMLAKAHFKLYIVSEMVFWIIYYLLTLVLIKHYALKGVVIAYFFSYLIYLALLGINYHKYFKHKNMLIR